MKKTEVVGVRVSQETKAALLKIAKEDERSVASIVDRALRKFVDSYAVQKKAQK